MLKKFTWDEKMLIIATIAMFCHYIPFSIVMTLIIIQAFIRHKLGYKKQPGCKYLYLFILLEFIVSLFHLNFVGMGNTLMFFAIALYVSYYREIINPKLFDHLCDIILILSVIVGIFGLFEFDHYSVLAGHTFFEFEIQNSPSRRVHTVFSNANLYAMMIDFFIVICMYRFVHTNQLSKRAGYFMIALFNACILYLTGSRTALLPFVVIFPIFLNSIHWKKLFYLSIILEALACILIFMHPSLIPRIDDMSTLTSRFEIWSVAWICIQTYPLLGCGPQTYKWFYPQVNGHKAPHAHNLYIDSFLSYGIIGTFIIIMHLYKLFKEIKNSTIKQDDPALFGMILCFIAIALIYGLLDCTLNMITTGTLFFIILNSACMYSDHSVQ